MSREVVTALPGWASRAAAALEEARERTLSLVRGLSDEALRRQHSSLMSPVVWDLGHVANYEEQWLVRALGAPPVASPEIDTLFDAVRHPRSTRERLALPSPAAAFEYLAAVRARTLEWLERISSGRALVPAAAEGLVREGFVWGMVAQHEHQHAETLCAALQLMTDPPWSAPEDPPFAKPNPRREVDPRAEVFVPAGPCRIGTRTDPWAYDNERGEHEVEVPAFYLDRHPVTCGRYLEFIEDGGYRRRELWSDEGWAHVQREGLASPLFWERSARSGSGASGRWVRRRFGTVEPIPLDEPVMHVCWYEAAAFARWSGRRLPTELEWEKAASWDPRTAARRRYPWGDEAPTPQRANLWTGRFGPLPIGSHPEGASAVGCEGMLGDVWEWTASEFRPWPCFAAFPYDEYSALHFGPRYRVLRGGAWATHPLTMRNTFRNWDFPIRRQIFAGFRCARDG